MGKNMGRTRLEHGAADDEAGTKASAGRMRSCVRVGSWELGLGDSEG